MDFGKKIFIGVSVTPELGLEVAQINTATNTVVKYANKPLEFNSSSRTLADIDVFKQTLSDTILELEIPKGAQVLLNLPAVTFNVTDYPAAMDDGQISNAIEEELAEHPLYKNTMDPDIAAAMMPSASMQFQKIAYTTAQKSVVLEIVMILKELGLKVYAIDTSVNSIVRALIYKERVDVSPDANWLLLIVESYCVRVILMIGKNYVDAFEEKISIGEVLGDAENYATVINTVSPLLKNLPSKYLCVVSKTNVISAEVLASKLTYSAPIIHQEANAFSREAFMDLAPSVDENYAKAVSMDVIGISLYKDFEASNDVVFNLYNESLGTVYLDDQPPMFMINGRKIILSNELLTKIFVVLFIIVASICALLFVFAINPQINEANEKLTKLNNDIAERNKYLADNKDISSDDFSEGDEISFGIGHNKDIYTYYTIVGTEIPKKLWLTHLKLSDKVTIEGQADNLESVYAFFRNIKDYKPESGIKLQQLGLASSSKLNELSGNGGFDTDSILTSLNADFYQFRISNEEEKSETNKDDNNDLPGFEPIKESN